MRLFRGHAVSLSLMVVAMIGLCVGAYVQSHQPKILAAKVPADAVLFNVVGLAGTQQDPVIRADISVTVFNPPNNRTIRVWAYDPTSDTWLPFLYRWGDPLAWHDYYPTLFSGDLNDWELSFSIYPDFYNYMLQGGSTVLWIGSFDSDNNLKAQTTMNFTLGN